MPLEIQPTQDPKNPLLRGLSAIEDQQNVGYLNYTLGSGPVSLDDVKVVTPRHGIGKALLQEFVRLIGPNRFITGVVIHEDTLHHLESLGLLKEAANKKVDITEQELLSNVPIVRFLGSGGISTISLAISCIENPGHGYEFVDQFNVELNAITLVGFAHHRLRPDSIS